MGMKNWRQFNESSKGKFKGKFKDKFSAELVLDKIIELSNEINDLLRLRFDDEGYDYEFYEIAIWEKIVNPSEPTIKIRDLVCFT